MKKFKKVCSSFIRLIRFIHRGGKKTTENPPVKQKTLERKKFKKVCSSFIRLIRFIYRGGTKDKEINSESHSLYNRTAFEITEKFFSEIKKIL